MASLYKFRKGDPVLHLKDETGEVFRGKVVRIESSKQPDRVYWVKWSDFSGPELMFQEKELVFDTKAPGGNKAYMRWYKQQDEPMGQLQPAKTVNKSGGWFKRKFRRKKRGSPNRNN